MTRNNITIQPMTMIVVKLDEVQAQCFANSIISSSVFPMLSKVQYLASLNPLKNHIIRAQG